jgi:hypothetical protein
MKYYIFYREQGDFTDILKDSNIKKYLTEKVLLKNYLIVGISKYTRDIDKIFSYITLKYGDDIRNSVTEKDYSPIPHVDYVPVRK